MQTSYTPAVFVQGPDTGDFAEAYKAHNALMGSTPAYVNTYTDGSQSPSKWSGNVGWGSGKFNQSGLLGSTTPLIGLVMTSTALSSAQNLELLQAVAAGSTDYVDPISGATINWEQQITGYVLSWKAAGYTTQCWRIGVEMNLTSTPGFEGYVSNPAAWVAAFKFYAQTLHAAGKANGCEIITIWNPGTANGSPIGNATEVLYPSGVDANGVQFVDAIGADSYADVWPYGPLTIAEVLASPAAMTAYYDNPAMNGSGSLDASGGSCLSLAILCEFARAQGKPLYVCETGAGNSSGGHDVSDNPVWPQWLRSALDAEVVKGLVVPCVSIWDHSDGSSGTYCFYDGSRPQEAAAWAKYFGANAVPISVPVSPVAPVAPVVPVAPVAPSLPTASAPNTTFKAGMVGAIVDNLGQSWDIEPNTQVAFAPAGSAKTIVESSWEVVELWWGLANDLYQLNSSGNWYRQPLSNTSGTPLTGLPPGYEAPVVTPPAPTFTVSTAGAQIPAPMPPPIVTSDGTSWTLPTKGGQIYGQPIGASAPSVVSTSLNVEALFLVDPSHLVQLNTKGEWWTQPLNGSAGTLTTQPTGYKSVIFNRGGLRGRPFFHRR